VLTGAVRGGVLLEPPLIEKGGVTKNDSCSSVILFLNTPSVHLSGSSNQNFFLQKLESSKPGDQLVLLVRDAASSYETRQ
jgi:hypothetical protein